MMPLIFRFAASRACHFIFAAGFIFVTFAAIDFLSLFAATPFDAITPRRSIADYSLMIRCH
jgi:hypothetical protein